MPRNSSLSVARRRQQWRLQCFVVVVEDVGRCGMTEKDRGGNVMAPAVCGDLVLIAREGASAARRKRTGER